MKMLFPFFSTAIFLWIAPAFPDSGYTESLSFPEALPEAIADGSRWIPLSGDKLLIGDDHGKIRLRSADGYWSAEKGLPFRHVAAIVADPYGFLVSGRMPGPVDLDLIALFDTTGSELVRWYPPISIFDLSAGRKGRWAATKDGLLPLHEDGNIGLMDSLPKSFPPGFTAEIRLFEIGETRVLCRGADLSMDFRDFARCQELKPDGWSFMEDAGLESPSVCGPWMILRMRQGLDKIVVRSLISGERMGERELIGKRGHLTPIACVDSATIAIGGHAIEFAHLPTLKTLWTKPLHLGPVSHLAVLRGQVVFQTFATSRIYSFRWMDAGLRSIPVEKNTPAPSALSP